MQQHSKYILIFIGFWFLINATTAAYTGLSADEAYYWVYGRKLDWGYFDHPPMIALFNSVIDRHVIHHELSVRIMTVLATCLYIWFVFKVVKPENIKRFVLLLFSIIALHINGFISTPDTPLLLFSGLFYWLFIRYVEKQSWRNALGLSVVVALLFYSKYHAVLIVFFSLLAVPQVFKRPSFYWIFLGSLVMYLPHILWQINHEYPSVKYHFFERNASEYELKFTLDYFLTQILFYGPFLLVPALLQAVRWRKQQTIATRVLAINMIGFLVFFLFNTRKDWVEVNWTLPILTPLMYFGYHFIETCQTRALQKTLLYGAVLSSFVLLMLRGYLLSGVGLFDPTLDRTRDFRGHQEMAHYVDSVRGDVPVVTTRYQEAALLSYYGREEVSSINLNGRKNIFNSWNQNPNINGNTYYIFTSDGHFDTTAYRSQNGTAYALTKLDQIPAYNGVTLDEVEISANQIKLYLNEEWLDRMLGQDYPHQTFLVVSISDKKTNKRQEQTLIDLEALTTNRLIIYKNLEENLKKGQYNIGIFLKTANFGTWSETWNKELTIE